MRALEKAGALTKSALDDIRHRVDDLEDMLAPNFCETVTELITKYYTGGLLIEEAKRLQKIVGMGQ